MPKIIVHRALPFQRGDTSIGIFVDGKAAGSLLSNNSLEIDVAPGAHKLRAFSNGARGREYPLELRETQSLDLRVQPWPQFAIKTHWWETFLLIAALAISDHFFGRYGAYIQSALFTAFFAVTTFRILRMRKETRNFLRIAPLAKEALAGASAASS